MVEKNDDGILWLLNTPTTQSTRQRFSQHASDSVNTPAIQSIRQRLAELMKNYWNKTREAKCYNNLLKGSGLPHTPAIFKK